LEDGSIFIKGVQYSAQTIVLPNSNFEASASTPVPGWTGSGATLTYETGSPYAGTQSLKVSSVSQYGGAICNQKWACASGDQFFVSAAIKSDGTAIPYLAVEFFDASNAYIGGIFAGGSTSTSWSVYTASGTAPANTVFLEIHLQNNAASQPSACYFDNVTVDRITILGTNVGDGAANFSATASVLSYRPTSNPLVGHDSGGSAEIDISSFNMLTSSKGTISYNSGSVSGLSYDTLYYVYVSSDPTLAGGATTYAASTTKTDALDGVGRLFVGSVRTPVSGGPDSTGNNDGGCGAQAGQTNVFSFSASSNTNSGTAVSGSIGSSSYDGDLTTYSAVRITNTNSSSASISSTMSGMPAQIVPYTSVTLYCRSAVPTNNITGSSNFCKITYSYAGGSGTILNQPATTTRAVTTDSVSLPTSINLGTLQISTLVSRNNGTSQTLELDLYEVWVVTTQ